MRVPIVSDHLLVSLLSGRKDRLALSVQPLTINTHLMHRGLAGHCPYIHLILLTDHRMDR